MLPAPNAQPSEVAEMSVARSADAENIHTVLAAQARGRSVVELWSGALVGATNAVLIWTRFPSLHWRAAGFAGTVGYGLWGLADRTLRAPDSSRLSRMLMNGMRVIAGASGWVA